MATKTARKYDSPRRAASAAETRTAVLDAARALFAEQGWKGTGMRDVARAAGVAVETVYANFGSKPDLLLAAVDVAIVGDDEPVAVADRPEFTAMGKGTPTERARAAARFVRQVNDRVAGLDLALREGAAGEAVLAERLERGDRQRRINVEQGTSLVVGRPVTEAERDGLWAVLSTDVYELLVTRSGWSGDQYEGWLADTIERLLR